MTVPPEEMEGVLLTVSPPWSFSVPDAPMVKISLTVRLYPARSRVPAVTVRSCPDVFNTKACARTADPLALLTVHVPPGSVPAECVMVCVPVPFRVTAVVLAAVSPVNAKVRFPPTSNVPPVIGPVNPDSVITKLRSTLRFPVIAHPVSELLVGLIVRSYKWAVPISMVHVRELRYNILPFASTVPDVYFRAVFPVFKFPTAILVEN